jgi:hypothetical protein
LTRLDGDAAALHERVTSGEGLAIRWLETRLPSEMALYRCTVSGVHGIPVMMMSDGALMVMMENPNTTVYVDLNCPDSNN